MPRVAVDPYSLKRWAENAGEKAEETIPGSYVRTVLTALYEYSSIPAVIESTSTYCSTAVLVLL